MKAWDVVIFLVLFALLILIGSGILTRGGAKAITVKHDKGVKVTAVTASGRSALGRQTNSVALPTSRDGEYELATPDGKVFLVVDGTDIATIFNLRTSWPRFVQTLLTILATWCIYRLGRRTEQRGRMTQIQWEMEEAQYGSATDLLSQMRDKLAAHDTTSFVNAAHEFAGLVDAAKEAGASADCVSDMASLNAVVENAAKEDEENALAMVRQALRDIHRFKAREQRRVRIDTR